MAEIAITSVACNHCGAPLEIQPTTNFVTCGYCGYKLQVHRSASSVYTEVLESIDQRTAQMAQDLNEIKRQNELERLDREWNMRRDSLLVRDKQGFAHEPSAFGSMIGAVAAVVFGCIWIGFAMSKGAPGFVPFIGAIIIIVGICAGVGGAARAARYEDEQRAYQHDRQQVMLRALQDSNRNEPK